LDDLKSPRNPWMSIFRKLLFEAHIPSRWKVMARESNLSLTVVCSDSFAFPLFDPLASTNSSNEFVILKVDSTQQLIQKSDPQNQVSYE